MLFMGWFPKRVVSPLRINNTDAVRRKINVFLSFFCRKADVNVKRIAINPSSGIKVFKALMAFCCCSMYVGADKFFGLYPIQIPKIVPATKATTIMLKKRTVFFISRLLGG